MKKVISETVRNLATVHPDPSVLTDEQLSNAAEIIISGLPTRMYIFQDCKKVLEKDSEDSYIERETNIIHVGLQSIVEGVKLWMKNCKKKVSTLDTWYTIEQIARSIYWHEVGHAFKTPKYNPKFGAYKIPAETCAGIHNIVADEVLETFCSNFFLGVDFFQNVLLLNGFTSVKEVPEPRDPLQAFYSLFRFRKGDMDFLAEAKRIIRLGMKYDSSTSKGDYEHYVQNPSIDLYCMICDRMGVKPEDTSADGTGEGKTGGYPSGESGDSGTEGKSAPKKGEKSSDGESSEKKSSESKGKSASSSPAHGSDGGTPEPSDEEAGETGEDEETKDVASEKLEDAKDFSESHPEKAPENLFSGNPYTDNTIKAVIETAFKTLERQRSQVGLTSAKRCLSGKFSPKLLATKNDCKWWVKPATTGGLAGVGGVNFNLFIDVSGSFHREIGYVNKMICTLVQINKQYPDIKVRVFACGMGEREIFGEDRYSLKADGGNRLDNKVFDLIKSCCPPTEKNYTLVLFDGNAWSDGGDRAAARAFAVPGTVVISDYENRGTFEKYVHNKNGARCIFVGDNYSEYLEQEISNIFEALILGS